MLFKLGGWNIRGLNDPLKQVVVSNFISNNNLSLVGIIETHVQESQSSRIKHRLKPSWHFIDNYVNNIHGRILVGWDPEVMKVSVIHSSTQAIFLDILYGQNIHFVVTMVYGDNDLITRRLLWEDINAFASYNTAPWILLGDFNSILEVEDKFSRVEVTNSQFFDF